MPRAASQRSVCGPARLHRRERGQVPGIRVVDPLTVEITLDNPSGALPYWLTMTMASIVPKAYASEVGYEAFEKEPIGSGPYRLASYEPTSSIVLERNADYWQP